MSLEAAARSLLKAELAADRIGEDVVLTSVLGVAVNLRAMYQENFELLDVDTGASVVSTQPRLLIVATDAPADAEGMTVTARGEVFDVTYVEPGTVKAHLYLARRS